MKKIRFSFILVVIFMFSTSLFAQQQIISVGNSSNEMNQTVLLSQNERETTIRFDLNQIELAEVETDYGNAFIVMSNKAPLMLEQGAPELFYLTSSFIIPDRGSSELTVLYGAYQDFENIELAPSKGNLTRSVDPKTVPFVKGDLYQQNAFYPNVPAKLREAFIMRDVRGQSLDVYPVQYNPVTKVLRVYSEITVTVNFTDEQGENEFVNQKRNATIEPQFNEMYKNLFINHSALQQRGHPTGEEGEILVICYNNTAFLDAIQPYVDWKRTMGRKTTLVTTATAGTTAAAIKTYITNYYNNAANNLAYVLIVGDNAQVPIYTYANSGTTSYDPDPTVCSDNYLGQITGGDRYMEVLVGRMSAETAAQVQTQVQRSIWYERDLTTADTWLSAAIGIATNEGTGGHDGGEADHVHMNNIRNRMLTYGYNPVYQEYGYNAGVTNTSVTQISSRFNSGAGIANYCNHGSETAWTLTNSAYGYLTFGVTQVNALTNAGKLPFIFSVACLNGRIIYSSPCFAEGWMRATQSNQPTGAIATLMASISLGWAPPMTAQDEFVNICMDLPSPYSGTQPGTKRTFAGAAINATQKMMMVHSGLTTQEDFDSWNVFGDPALMFRTKTPQAMTVTHNNTLSAGATSLAVTCNVNDALAALTYIENNEVKILGTAVVQSGAAQITFPAVAAGLTLKLTVTGFNRVTYTGAISVTGSGPQLCEKPVGLAGSVNGYNATITWNAPTNIDGTLTGYNIYRDGVKKGETSASVRTFTENNLPVGTYVYKVTAKYAHCNESPLSDGQTVVIVYIPVFCEKPVGLAGSVNGYNATITWNAPTNIDGTLTGYNIYRDGVKKGETSASVRTFTENNLPVGTYVYKVTAKYAHCNESPLSDGQTVVISYIPTLCEKPIGLAGSVNGYDATITWNAPVNIDDNLLGYKVYRDDIKVGETTAAVREFTDENLAVGSYTYQVSAKYEHCTESEKCAGETVEVVHIPVLCEKPINVSVEVDECTATISWEEPENIDGVLLKYKLYINGELSEYEYPTTEAVYTLVPLHGNSGFPFIVQVSAMYAHCFESELTDEVNFDLCVPQLCEIPLNLSGTPDQNTAVLSWNAPENVDGVLLGYNIYRNENKINDLPIEAKEYSDEELAEGIYNYQVSAVYDHCPESDLTDIVAVIIKPEAIHEVNADAFNIYPNPTTGVLNLIQEKIEMCDMRYEIGYIEIYDIFGKNHYVSNLKSQISNHQINISHLSAGVYFVKIYTETGEVIKKVVKM